MWTVSFSVPKPQNIEIRSSVQQRPIFTIIYHSCPCTQGLITPYMVNKPLTCSRHYVVHKKSQRTVTMSPCVQSTFFTPRKIRTVWCVWDYLDVFVCRALFFQPATPHQCWKLCCINKQRPRPSLAGSTTTGYFLFSPVLHDVNCLLDLLNKALTHSYESYINSPARACYLFN